MIGKTISHYKILEKLGEGGMGVVYKAEDTKLQRTVALKFLPLDVASDDELRKRFINEARTASALNHPNVCTIYSVEDGDQPFIAMEFVAGRELREIVGATGPVAPTKAINYATQIAAGLQAAHKKGIVHRDIKPANMMVTDDGLVKVMDFGLAKMKGQPALTKTGSTLGTIAYMSPEQASNEEVDHRSDIFSFGAVLYELCSGRQPFQGDYEAATLYSVVHEQPEALPDGVPAELQRVVFKCLEKQAEDRYQSAEHLLAALREIKYEPDSSTRPAAIAKKQKNGNRTMVMLAGAVIVLLVFVVAQWGGLFKADRQIPHLTNPRQITSATGVEDFPTWSPD
ncbi:MAG: serine/threonine-protein kinase, partial [Lysobacterales bacterium]